MGTPEGDAGPQKGVRCSRTRDCLGQHVVSGMLTAADVRLTSAIACLGRTTVPGHYYRHHRTLSPVVVCHCTNHRSAVGCTPCMGHHMLVTYYIITKGLYSESPARSVSVHRLCFLLLVQFFCFSFRFPAVVRSDGTCFLVFSHLASYFLGPSTSSQMPRSQSLFTAESYSTANIHHTFHPRMEGDYYLLIRLAVETKLTRTYWGLR